MTQMLSHDENMLDTHRFQFCPKCTMPLTQKVLFDDNILRLTCSECGWIQLVGNAVGVAVLAHKGDLIAVIEPPGEDGVALPAGLVEYGESPADAAVREVREETGLEVKLVAELGWLFVKPKNPKPDDWPGPMIQFMYEAEVIGGQLKGSDEGIARFVYRDSFPSIATGRTGSQRTLAAYLAKLGQ